MNLVVLINWRDRVLAWLESAEIPIEAFAELAKTPAQRQKSLLDGRNRVRLAIGARRARGAGGDGLAPCRA